MRSSTLVFFFLATVGSIVADSEPVAFVLEGEDYEHDLSWETTGNTEGIKRRLDTPFTGKWQVFYFCEIPKNKKQCGAWLDEKGNKVKGANNKVKKTKIGATVSKMTAADAGYYARVTPNPKENQEDTNGVRVSVAVKSEPPKQH